MRRYLYTREHGLIEHRRPYLTWCFGLGLALAIGTMAGYTPAAYHTRVALEIIQAQTNGLLNAAGHFEHPKRETTRAQAAVIVERSERE